MPQPEEDEEDPNSEHEEINEQQPLIDQKVYLEKEEIRTENKIRRKKVRQIRLRDPIVLQKLFPSPFYWDFTFTFYYLWNFVLIVVGFVVLGVSIHLHVSMAKRWQTLGGTLHDQEDVVEGAIVVFCATIMPQTFDDVLEYNGVPYASLPIGNSHFYKPGPLLTFIDCYKAFWVDLRPEQRKFENGRITFFSVSKDIPCKQIGPSGSSIIGKDSCLTISLKSKVLKKPSRLNIFKRNFIQSLLPVVVYITGRTYMENRPFPVGNSIVRQSNAIFIVINYRLNVLGFSNFELMKSPRNIGYNDVLVAINFIHKYIHLFNGNGSRMCLLAEESGATTGLVSMLMSKDLNLFTRAWLIDGSAFIPNPPARSLFYELYASKDILCNSFINPEDIFECLQNFSSNILLRHSPKGWVNSNNYFYNLPNLFEERNSIIEKVEGVVNNPLDTVRTPGSEMIDIPIVIMSTVDYLPYWQNVNFLNRIGNLTKKELYTKTRLGLINYQTASSQILLHSEINIAYKEYIAFIENRSLFYQNLNEYIIPLGFEEVLKAIISDIRSVCPYTALAKYLQVNAHVVKGPIYRIIDAGRRFTGPSLQENSTCDLNFFLQDESSECVSAPKDIPNEYKRTLVKSFISFLGNGKIDGALQMEYPQNSKMKEFEDTFTFIGRLGLRTAGVRETGLLQACNIWKSGTDEYPMLKTSSKVN